MACVCDLCLGREEEKAERGHVDERDGGRVGRTLERDQREREQ